METGGIVYSYGCSVRREERARREKSTMNTIQKDTVPPSPPLHPFLPLSWSCCVCGVARMVLIIANSALIANC
jgi:hypothetical protein